MNMYTQITDYIQTIMVKIQCPEKQESRSPSRPRPQQG